MRGLFILSLIVGLFIGCSQGEQEQAKKDAPLDNQHPIVNIDTEFGRIRLELWPDVAPNHVANFLDLADSGFYTGLVWHRVMKDFIIQCGSPSGDISGHAGYVIPAEFSGMPHNPGTLSMARGKDPNSASCQFFICLTRRPELDGQYSVFGRTIEGMDVVQKIGKLETDDTDRPLEDVHILRIWQEGRDVPPLPDDGPEDGA